MGHDNRTDVCNTNEMIVQLKMFCGEGNKVRIRECDKDEIKQQWIFHECTIRPKFNERLCVTAGETRSNSDKGSIELHACDPGEKIQYFRTFDPNNISKKFQFKFF